MHSLIRPSCLRPWNYVFCFIVALLAPAVGDVCFAEHASAEYGVCYATLGNGDSNAGALVTIDVSTGAATFVGPTGILGASGNRGVPALAITSAGEVYAMDIGSSSRIYIVNASTGAATLLGVTSLSSPPAIAFDGNDLLHAVDINGDLYTIKFSPIRANFVGSTNVSIKGMAFDPVTAILWGCDGSSNVYTIDHRTGQATLIGNTGQSPSPDLCFNADNELIASSGGGLSDNNLIMIDKATGTGTVIGLIGYRSVSGMAMRHDRLSPATLQAHDARWVEGHVEITWRLIDLEGELSFDILRAPGVDADFEMMHDAIVKRRGEEFVFEDRSTKPSTTYLYRVVIRENGIAMTSFESPISTPAGKLALYQNRPNPFNPATAISFSIEGDQHVRLRVYDVFGRIIATLVDRPMRAGEHTALWNGRDKAGNSAAAGVYFFELTAGKKSLTRKSVLVK